MHTRRFFFGWRVVAAAFVHAVFAWGISFYGPPIFLEVLHASRGWPIATISVAITVHFLVGAAIVARLSALHWRFGIVAMTRAGGLLTGFGLLSWAFAQAPWQLFLAAPVSGAGWALTSGAALNAMISPWFIRRRPAALAMAFNGASMGGVIFSPLWVGLIATLGFATAAMVVAATAALALWVLAGRYFGRNPAAMGLQPDGTTAAALAPAAVSRSAAPLPRPLRDRRLLTLVAASTLALMAQIGLIAHLFSLLVPIMDEAVAGVTMGATTACAIVGRLALGFLTPADADRRLVAAANVCMQATGSVLLMCAGSSLPMALLGCALFGLGLGNVTSLPPLIAQCEFLPADVPRVVSLVTAISQAGYAFAPAAFGLLRSLGGPAATFLFAAALLIQLAAVGTMLLGRDRPFRRTAVLKRS